MKLYNSGVYAIQVIEALGNKKLYDVIHNEITHQYEDNYYYVIIDNKEVEVNKNDYLLFRTNDSKSLLTVVSCIDFENRYT